MIELGVDEITVVLQLLKSDKSLLGENDWTDIAENLIWNFEKKSDIVTVFGDKRLGRDTPSGYTVSYTYGEHPFYFAVAYHEYRHDMGIVVKFSAQSLDYYLNETGLKVYQFLQNISCQRYSHRLSRIDLTADYIDEDIDITGIYQTLMDGTTALFREQENKRTGEMQLRNVPMNYEGYLKKTEVPTIYIGSMKSTARLRIYDKKREQIEKKGTKLEKALKCNNWIRFEAMMRHEYAHQISEELMRIKTDSEYLNLIAVIITQKYRFMETDEDGVRNPAEYTQLLLDCISSQQFQLKSVSTENYELANSIAYIFYGSGIMQTLYKLKAIWGAYAVIEIMEYMLEVLETDFKPNDNCRYWLSKNLNDYKKRYQDFKQYMYDDVVKLL